MNKYFLILLLLGYVLINISISETVDAKSSDSPQPLEEFLPEIGYKTVESALKDFEQHFNKELKLPLRVPPISFTHRFGRFSNIDGDINDEFEVTMISDQFPQNHFKINVRPIQHKIPFEKYISNVFKLKNGSNAAYIKNPKFGFDMLVFERDNWQYVFSIDQDVSDKPNTHYSYTYSDERFERPIMDAYKISIHHSYREEGKVKKKQWSICTMDYYDLAESWYGDFIVTKNLQKKLVEMGIEENTLHEIISIKIDSLVEQIEAEFQQSEEYKAKLKYDEITTLYATHKEQLESEYGADTYNYCYDVFGELLNPKYLEKLKVDKKARDEYINQSKEESYKRFEEQFNNNSGHSYSTVSTSNYSEEEKKLLHEIYRMASKKFHPDVSGDDGSRMKILTKLKEEWGL